MDNGAIVQKYAGISSDTFARQLNEKTPAQQSEIATQFIKKVKTAIIDLHDKGIVHRDIKLENIAVKSEDLASFDVTLIILVVLKWRAIIQSSLDLKICIMEWVDTLRDHGVTPIGIT